MNSKGNERKQDFLDCLGNGKSIIEIEAEEEREEIREKEILSIRLIAYYCNGWKYKMLVIGKSEVFA